MTWGMPHEGAHYRSANANDYEADSDICCICGRRATDVHHQPPKGMGGTKGHAMATPRGTFVLFPALLRVCRECHDAIHRHEIDPVWEWNDAAAREEWESGELLAHGWVPHDERLKELGSWKFQS